MKIPFFQKLEQAETVLLAGAGGGYDVLCGLPLYFWLRNAGKTVHLANLSFADVGFCDAENPAPALFCVTSRTNGSREYFPEIHLAAFLDKHFGDTPVYAIERTGAKPILGAYQWMVNTLKPDTLLVIDAGTDSLMRGDESGLGTPQEDAASLFAANAVTGPQQKFLVSVGFGIDYFHGVCHAQFLENVAALSKTGGYLGAWSLTHEMPEFDFYERALAFVSERMPGKRQYQHCRCRQRRIRRSTPHQTNRRLGAVHQSSYVHPLGLRPDSSRPPQPLPRPNPRHHHLRRAVLGHREISGGAAQNPSVERDPMLTSSAPHPPLWFHA
jgi:hypothetical protein